MICPSCQKEITAGSKFCYSCGARQAETAASPVAPNYSGRKRFVRSTNDRKIAGVCAGVADYFDIDTTLVRVLWLIATFIPGPNLLAYIILWIAVPEGTTRAVSTSTQITS